MKSGVLLILASIFIVRSAAADPLQPSPTTSPVDHIERFCSGISFENLPTDNLTEQERTRFMVALICQISKSTAKQATPNPLSTEKKE